jgi:hypothetical protein
MDTLPIQLRDRVLATARALPVQTRARVRLRRAVVLLCGAFVGLVVFSLAGGARIGPRPVLLVVAASAAGALIAGFAAGVLLTRGASMLGRPYALRIGVVVGAPPMAIAARHLLSAAFEGMVRVWPHRAGFRCLALALAIGLAPTVAFGLAFRRSQVVTPGFFGAGVGVALGLSAGVLVDLWCPVAYLPHLLLGHLLPVMILGVAGCLIGRRLLAI